MMASPTPHDTEHLRNTLRSLEATVAGLPVFQRLNVKSQISRIRNTIQRVEEKERRSQQLEKGLELDLDPATLLAMAVQQQQQVEEQEERWHMSPPVQMPRRQSVHVEQEEQPPLVVVHERHSGFPAGMGVSMVKVTNTSPRTSPRKTHPLVVDPILEGGQTAAADAQEKSAADSHDDSAADSLEDTAADSLEDTAASVELGGDHRDAPLLSPRIEVSIGRRSPRVPAVFFESETAAVRAEGEEQHQHLQSETQSPGHLTHESQWLWFLLINDPMTRYLVQHPLPRRTEPAQGGEDGQSRDLPQKTILQQALDEFGRVFQSGRRRARHTILRRVLHHVVMSEGSQYAFQEDTYIFQYIHYATLEEKPEPGPAEIQQLQHLGQLPSVSGHLVQLWEEIPKNSIGSLTKKAYSHMMGAVYQALVPDIQAAEGVRLAEMDWEHEPKLRGGMEFNHFVDSILSLADTWTGSFDEHELCRFVEEISSICMPSILDLRGYQDWSRAPPLSTDSDPVSRHTSRAMLLEMSMLRTTNRPLTEFVEPPRMSNYFKPKMSVRSYRPPTRSEELNEILCRITGRKRRPLKPHEAEAWMRLQLDAAQPEPPRPWSPPTIALHKCAENLKVDPLPGHVKSARRRSQSSRSGGGTGSVPQDQRPTRPRTRPATAPSQRTPAAPSGSETLPQREVASRGCTSARPASRPSSASGTMNITSCPQASGMGSSSARSSAVSFQYPASISVTDRSSRHSLASQNSKSGRSKEHSQHRHSSSITSVPIHHEERRQVILSMLHSDRRKALQQRMAEYAATKRAADPMWGQGVLQLEVQNLTGDMSPRTAELVDLKAELAEQHRIQQGSESWQQNPHRTLTQYSAEEPEGTLDPEYELFLRREFLEEDV